MAKPQKKCPPPYTQHDVNLKIMEGYTQIRGEREIAGFLNKHRDENYANYERKLHQFMDTAHQYKEMNKLSLVNHNKIKLEKEYMKLKFEFLNDFVEDIPLIELQEYKPKGYLLRKRTERKIGEFPDIDGTPNCFMEPWFRRYIKLGKFIQAARKIIIKNRLLKNLAILRKLTEEKIQEFETMKKQCDNVSYNLLFDKFLYP